MATYKYRIAKPCDARQLAEVHYHVRDRYTQGIFLSLGKFFLKAYYEVILNDPYEVVICAEKEDGTVVGFSSASLDSAKQLNNLKKHRIKLGIAALWAIIKRPSLFKDLWQRYQSISNSNAPQFVNKEGVRGEYWCWLPTEKDPIAAVETNMKKDKVLACLGVDYLFFEVDKFNESVLKYHLKKKAEILEEIKLPDGRERVLMRVRLKK